MALHVYLSRSIESLAFRLSEHILSERKSNDFFLPARVIVPNLNLKKWLQMRLAENNGAAVNIRFQFIESALWEIIREKGGDALGGAALLSQGDLLLMILSRLIADIQGDPLLAPFRDYLCLPDGQEREDFFPRAFQLAERLAQYFRDYEYHRGEMIEAWLQGKTLYGGDEEHRPAVETAQREIYTRLFAPGGLRDVLAAGEGGRRLTLPQGAREVISGAARQGIAGASAPSPLHLFGLSLMSEFHIRLLHGLGEEREVHVYLLDVGTSSEGDPGPVTRWAQPGRDTISLLLDPDGGKKIDPQYIPSELPLQGTLLEFFQGRLYDKSSERPEPPGDSSLLTAGCPDRYREAETVYNSILHSMMKDETLKLTDIAVLVPDLAGYLPALRSVFEREPRHIPFNLSDTLASEESPYARGITALLDLAAGDFSRREVFRLLCNPCVLKKRGLERGNVDVWMRWAEELNIFRGWRETPDSGEWECPVHTWSTGLARLRLGRLMEMPRRSMTAQDTRHYRGLIPFSDISSRDPDLLNAFSSVMEDLRIRLGGLRGQRLSPLGWKQKIGELAELFLDADGEEGDEAVRTGLRESLERLNFLENLLSADGGLLFPLDFIREYVRTIFVNMPGGTGSYLTGGVSITSLLPMRPVPFRIIYVMGMGEGDFPGMADESLLNIRAWHKRMGDAWRPEENRFLFLETLLSARDRLCITYVSRDLQKDRIIHPSSLIYELREYLRGLGTGLELSLREVPLRGDSERYLKPHREGDIWENYSGKDRLICLNRLLSEGKISPRGKQLREYEAVRAERMPDYSLPRLESPAIHDDGTAARRIDLKDLVSYLYNPAGASVKRHLGLYDDTDGIDGEAEFEPLYLASSEEKKLVRQALNLYAVSGDPDFPLQRRISDYYDRLIWEGAAPPPPYSVAEKERIQNSTTGRAAGRGKRKEDASLEGFLSRRASWSFYSGIRLGEVPYLEDVPALSFPSVRVTL